MCVIAYKPLNVAFPEEQILKNCFENNPHGAGFMYAYNGVVHFQKGYESFKAFNNALSKARKLTGDKVPYVMHFRIATQGYEKCMTHPFPLSSDMKKLKKLSGDCNIGVAHNGILDITSDGSKEYSDTMKFITDYLVYIIRNYSWWKDDRTKKLIENLIDGSRLAILDKKGHCELMGKGWVEENEIWYSNSSYSYEKKIYTYNSCGTLYDDGYSLKWWKPNYTSSFGKVVEDDGYDNTPLANSGYDPYAEFYDSKNGEYEFDDSYCPFVMEDDDSYCCACAYSKQCKFMRAVSNWE